MYENNFMRGNNTEDYNISKKEEKDNYSTKCILV